MSRFQQLILRALSTTSEHEALACLAKARKEPQDFTGSVTSLDGKSIHEWKRVALYWQDQSKHGTVDGMSASSWKKLAVSSYKMHKASEAKCEELAAEVRQVRLEKEEWSRSHFPVLVSVGVVSMTVGLTVGILFAM
jgi:hypothetical protein